ncbi:hypothetical protein CR513_42786, partial [Mucuna pruriens]
MSKIISSDSLSNASKIIFPCSPLYASKINTLNSLQDASKIFSFDTIADVSKTIYSHTFNIISNTVSEVSNTNLNSDILSHLDISKFTSSNTSGRFSIISNPPNVSSRLATITNALDPLEVVNNSAKLIKTVR